MAELHKNETLEAYIAKKLRNGGVFKPTHAAAARSVVDETEKLLRRQGFLTLNNRQHLRMCLESATIPSEIAHEIAGLESVVG